LRDVLARYERALSSHDLAAARALNAGLTRDQLRGFEQFFSRASDFSARLALTTSEIRERSADGVVAAVYDYTMDGRKQRQSFTLRATFENVGGEWRLQSLK
jgi:hypothetical protein